MVPVKEAIKTNAEEGGKEEEKKEDDEKAPVGNGGSTDRYVWT